MGPRGGLLALAVLVLDVYAIVQTSGSRAQPSVKTLWIVIILALPLLGPVLWYFAGPKSDS
jgi:hypothetical protein